MPKSPTPRRPRLARAALALVALAACSEPVTTVITDVEAPEERTLSSSAVPASIDAHNLAALSASSPATATAMNGPSMSVSGASDPSGFISNGTIMLGINQHGALNVPGGPRSLTGTTIVGLRYLPTGAASTEPGCTCEGWGAADNLTKEWGGQNTAEGGPRNLTLESFVRTSSTATSVVRIGSRMRVTHEYAPSPATANLYEVKVTIENISAAPVEALYRRVMDWDIEPTPFAERVTLQRGTAANLYRTDNNGFNSSNPFSFSSYGKLNVNFVDHGPSDHGALFDFNFGTLAPGAKVEFKTFYGAAGTEADALAALGSVGAEAYSLGQTSTGYVTGQPNTFVFAFAGIGGEPVVEPTDASAPVIVPTVSGTAGANGWYTSPVTVSWAVTDDESAVSGTTGCEAASVSSDNAGTTFTCSATSAGGTASESVTIKVDGTAPVIASALAGTLGNNGWYRSNVGVTWTVTDATSGAATSCASDALGTDGAQTFSCTAEDNAGNSSSASVTVKRDATSPVVSYAGNGGTYTVDQDVSITCSAVDATSGVASHTCADVTGPAYDFDLGANSFSASATDNAGNTGSGSVTFTVVVTESSLCALATQWSGNLAGSLCTKLDNAAAAGARGSDGARSNIIGAFINAVEAQSGKKIPAAQAAILVRLAQAL